VERAVRTIAAAVRAVFVPDACAAVTTTVAPIPVEDAVGVESIAGHQAQILPIRSNKCRAESGRGRYWRRNGIGRRQWGRRRRGLSRGLWRELRCRLRLH